MSLLKEKGIQLLGTITAVTLSATAKNTLYTVSTGKEMYPVFAIADSFSAAAATAKLDFGVGDSCTSWATGKSATGITATSMNVVLTNNNSVFVMPTAGSVFGVQTGATDEVATCRVRLFGFEA
ncbi:MAG: hypothetical protein GY841_16090 [FCB group bacterium]|nr:hypothetical protein [FCB group bacterium]